MSHVASELKKEMERQALNNWSNDAFGLVEPGVAACSACCLWSSGGHIVLD